MSRQGAKHTSSTTYNRFQEKRRQDALERQKRARQQLAQQVLPTSSIPCTHSAAVRDEHGILWCRPEPPSQPLETLQTWTCRMQPQRRRSSMRMSVCLGLQPACRAPSCGSTTPVSSCSRSGWLTYPLPWLLSGKGPCSSSCCRPSHPRPPAVLHLVPLTYCCSPYYRLVSPRPEGQRCLIITARWAVTAGVGQCWPFQASMRCIPGLPHVLLSTSTLHRHHLGTHVIKQQGAFIACAAAASSYLALLWHVL